METVQLICIGCPMGCPMTVTLENGAVTSVVGNTCRRGDVYARKEVTAPTRIVTSTVRVTGSKSGAVTVPCKTKTDLPKGDIFRCMRALTGVTVAAPIRIGDVLVPNIAGTGVDIIATKDVE